MSIIIESSICNVTLNYVLSSASAQLPSPASWWTLQIDGIESKALKDAMRSEFPELQPGTHPQNRLLYSSEEDFAFDVMAIMSKTTQYLSSITNMGYRLVASTVLQEISSGVVQYQYCFQK